MKRFQNLKPVKDMKIDEKSSVNSLITQMFDSGGFTAKKLAVGVDILERMFKEKNCLKFLSFPACIIATGTRGIIKEMVRRKLFDVLVTTCGTLDHDLARVWKDYYHGSFLMDDRQLYKKHISRLGNILVTDESYGINVEKKMIEFLKEIYAEGKRELSTHELVWKLGRRIKNKDSIMHWSYKNKIPMIVPGITDGAVGYHLWQFSQDHDFKIDVLKDEQFLSDLIWGAKKSGALVIGGGISKHHTIWWNMMKGGLDYVVYVTTAVEWDGSLSGARPREAVSWGKIKEKAKFVTVEGDATIILPIMLSSVLYRIKSKKI